VFLAELHALVSNGAALARMLWVRTEKRPPTAGCGGVNRCPAPTTSPAWRPARCLVFRGAFAPLSTNTRVSLKIFGFVGHVGRGAAKRLRGGSSWPGLFCGVVYANVLRDIGLYGSVRLCATISG
jgi:hypothetical protein